MRSRPAGETACAEYYLEMTFQNGSEKMDADGEKNLIYYYRPPGPPPGNAITTPPPPGITTYARGGRVSLRRKMLFYDIINGSLPTPYVIRACAMGHMCAIRMLLRENSRNIRMKILIEVEFRP